PFGGRKFGAEAMIVSPTADRVNDTSLPTAPAGGDPWVLGTVRWPTDPDGTHCASAEDVQAASPLAASTATASRATRRGARPIMTTSGPGGVGPTQSRRSGRQPEARVKFRIEGATATSAGHRTVPLGASPSASHGQPHPV